MLFLPILFLQVSVYSSFLVILFRLYHRTFFFSFLRVVLVPYRTVSTLFLFL